MILMPQIFDVTANENLRYKRNELECVFYIPSPKARGYKITQLVLSFMSEISDPPWMVNYLDGKWLAVLSKFVGPIGQSGILKENALTYPKLVQQ